MTNISSFLFIQLLLPIEIIFLLKVVVEASRVSRLKGLILLKESFSLAIYRGIGAPRAPVPFSGAEGLRF